MKSFILQDQSTIMSLSYFEMDEFGKIGGTIPSDKDECAQYLIVEADENNRVRVYPVDILSGNFFREAWKIDVPSDPSTFTYTERRAGAEKPAHFDDNAVITAYAKLKPCSRQCRKYGCSAGNY